MLMMRALCGLLQPIQKLARYRLALQGRLRVPRVLMMLAGWPPGLSTGDPETRQSLGTGCETQWKKEGPMKQGRRHCQFAKAKACKLHLG